jgi:uncharacterized protein with HEPN domain
MQPEIQTWLYDIIKAIDEVRQFTKEFNTVEEYAIDLKTKRAVERDLEIIGEAVNRIQKTGVANFTDARLIIGMRNRIIHGYDNISDELVWNVIQSYLGKLRSEAEKILQ